MHIRCFLAAQSIGVKEFGRRLLRTKFSINAWSYVLCSAEEWHAGWIFRIFHVVHTLTDCALMLLHLACPNDWLSVLSYGPACVLLNLVDHPCPDFWSIDILAGILSDWQTSNSRSIPWSSDTHQHASKDRQPAWRGEPFWRAQWFLRHEDVSPSDTCSDPCTKCAWPALVTNLFVCREYLKGTSHHLKLVTFWKYWTGDINSNPAWEG